MIEFSKKEIKHISLASLVLALVFGFDDKAPTFVLVHWLSNYFYILILVLIALLVHECAHKLVAKKYNYKTEYSLWEIKRYGFARKAIAAKNIPIGILLALFFIFFSAALSNGSLLVPFAAVGTFTLIKTKVIGKTYSPVEEIKISLAGPLTNIALAIIFLPFQTFSFINAVLAVYDLLPLPSLDGSKIFFKSRIIFMFVFILALLVILILQLQLGLVELFIAFLLALIITVIAVINYLYFFHFR